ncbi:hypothetical protein Acr_13g0009860 [Actinidia rufa]|uniref:PARP-type domain-containing protein n=1 Tax=Actinidia rufa TaxID=165716 RepID=A0A7J0FMJ6_9ERIC|nr:hypothetical protein Acr_13g0009860 [Actinidia rufa]
MANPTKPWKVEYAKSARSSCKTCKSTIDKEKLRLGKMVQAKTIRRLHACNPFFPLLPPSFASYFQSMPV